MEPAFLIALLVIGAGIGIGLTIWFCIVKPRIERRNTERDKETNGVSDEVLNRLQDESERVKQGAETIKEQVLRLQQLTHSREKAEEERRRREANREGN